MSQAEDFSQNDLPSDDLSADNPAEDQTSAEIIDITPFLESADRIYKSGLGEGEKRRELDLLSSTPGREGDAYREWLKRVKEAKAKQTQKKIGIAIGVAAVAAVGVIVCVVVPGLRKGISDLAADLLENSELPDDLLENIANEARVGLALGGGRAASLMWTEGLAKEVLKQGLIF